MTLNKTAKTTTAASIQFFNSLAAGAVGILGAMSAPSAMPGGWVLAMMIVAGGINILGNILYTTALQNTASTNVAQLHYTQIIYAAIIGYALWHEVPTWNLVAGSIIIIASGMVVAAQARKKGTQMIDTTFVAEASGGDE